MEFNSSRPCQYARHRAIWDAMPERNTRYQSAFEAVEPVDVGIFCF